MELPQALREATADLGFLIAWAANAHPSSHKERVAAVPGEEQAVGRQGLGRISASQQPDTHCVSPEASVGRPWD